MSSTHRHFRHTILPDITKELTNLREKITLIDTSLEECNKQKQSSIVGCVSQIAELQQKHAQSIAEIEAAHKTETSRITEDAQKVADASNERIRHQSEESINEIWQLKEEIAKLKSANHAQQTNQLKHNSVIEANQLKISELENLLQTTTAAQKQGLEELNRTHSEQTVQLEQKIAELTSTNNAHIESINTTHQAQIVELNKQHQEEMARFTRQIQILTTEKQALTTEISEMNVELESILKQSKELNALTDIIIQKNAAASSRGGKFIHKKRYTLQNRSQRLRRLQIVKRKSIQRKTKARK